MTYREKSPMKDFTLVVVVKGAPERGMKMLWEGGQDRDSEFKQLIQRFLLQIGEQAVSFQPVPRAFVLLPLGCSLLPCDGILSLHGVALDGMLVAEGGKSAVPLSFPCLMAAWGTFYFQQ